MRPAQKSNNRSRGRGNRKGGGNSLNRVYDSAGPEGKVRGTPQQIIEKYLTLARDAQTSGDRVTAENFLQHAEHYQRLLIQAMGTQEQARREQNEQQAEDQSADQDETDAQPAQPPADAAPEQAAQPRRQNNRRKPARAPAPEIGGMAMIDAEGDNAQSGLLVEPETMATDKKADPQTPAPPASEA